MFLLVLSVCLFVFLFIFLYFLFSTLLNLLILLSFHPGVTLFLFKTFIPRFLFSSMYLFAIYMRFFFFFFLLFPFIFLTKTGICMA